MNTPELKNILISKISQIDDEEVLSAINTILDSKSNSNVSFNSNLDKIIFLTEQQKKEILNSKKEYSEGNFIDNDILNEEMEKWLEKNSMVNIS
jgi:hypothetical protein